MHHFNKNNFKDWLFTFGPDQVIGIAQDRKNRPIANFLKERAEDVIVTPSRIYVDGEAFKTPDWARLFIHEADIMHPNEITPVKAAKILDEINDRI